MFHKTQSSALNLPHAAVSQSGEPVEMETDNYCPIRFLASLPKSYINLGTFISARPQMWHGPEAEVCVCVCICHAKYFGTSKARRENGKWQGGGPHRGTYIAATLSKQLIIDEENAHGTSKWPLDCLICIEMSDRRHRRTEMSWPSLACIVNYVGDKTTN